MSVTYLPVMSAVSKFAETSLPVEKRLVDVFVLSFRAFIVESDIKSCLFNDG